MSIAALAGWIGVLLPRRALAANGAIAGVITDSTDEPLPGVEIVAIREPRTSNPREYKTTSTDNGRYSIALPPGSYTVQAHLSGFESMSVDHVAIFERCNAVLNHQMMVGFIGERVVPRPKIAQVCDGETRSSAPAKK